MKLARKDSNLDKVIQSHLCYRYTTGQDRKTTDLMATPGAVKGRRRLLHGCQDPMA